MGDRKAVFIYPEKIWIEYPYEWMKDEDNQTKEVEHQEAPAEVLLCST